MAKAKPLHFETSPQIVKGGALHRRRNSRPAALLRWLKQGNSVNATEPSGHSLLHWYASSGNLDGVKVLLDHGADTDCADRSGATPLLLALNNAQPDIATLLLDRGADGTARWNDGRTALHCVFTWDIGLIRRLLDVGADPSLRNDRGESAIDRMAITDDEELSAEQTAIVELMSAKAGIEPTGPKKREVPPRTSRFDSSERWQATCRQIWDDLVPARGQADSVQGELLRAVEKLRDEALRNGNVNWSAGHRHLHRYLGKTLRAVHPLSPSALSQLNADLAEIGVVNTPPSQSDPYDRICQVIARLHLARPQPIARELDPKLRI